MVTAEVTAIQTCAFRLLIYANLLDQMLRIICTYKRRNKNGENYVIRACQSTVRLSKHVDLDANVYIASNEI